MLEYYQGGVGFLLRYMYFQFLDLSQTLILTFYYKINGDQENDLDVHRHVSKR